MKKIHLSVAAILLAGSVVCSSCVGSYALFNGYAKWQTTMTSNKYVNGIVGLIIGPFVGSITLFVDHVVLNTIEFWSGSNPIASNTMTVKGEDGRNYLVKVSKKGYEIKAPTGEVTLLIHDEQNDSWSMQQNGEVKEIFRYNADGTVTASLPNGEKMTVGQDEAGLNKIQQAVEGDLFFAQR